VGGSIGSGSHPDHPISRDVGDHVRSRRSPGRALRAHPPAFFRLLLQTKALLSFDARVAPAWPLGHAWATQGPPKGHPNPIPNPIPIPIPIQIVERRRPRLRRRISVPITGSSDALRPLSHRLMGRSPKTRTPGAKGRVFEIISARI